MIFGKTRIQIEQETIEQLASDSQVTNLNRGSTARSLVDAIGDQLNDVYQAIEANYSQSFLDLAAGQFLNLIGSTFGLTRRDSVAAHVSAQDEAIKFFTQDKSPLASHIPSKAIPVNTLVQTSNGDVVFFVSEDAPINDVQSEVFVSATAQDAGTVSRVGRAKLIKHDLGISTVSVTNTQDIGSGTDIESDAEFRLRISTATLLGQSGNVAALRSAALRTPGVSNVRIKEFPSGVGTVQVFLIPSGTIVPRDSFNSAEQLVSRARSAGIRVEVRQPNYVPVQLTVRLTFNKNTSDADQLRIKRAVPASIADYLDDIQLGGTLVLNQLRRSILSTSESIQDIQIVCYIIRNRPQLLKNFSLFEDELFIPDPSMSTPFRII